MPERDIGWSASREYLQDNTRENFESQEAQRVINDTKLQLNLLELAVLNNKNENEKKWWDDEALHQASEYLWNFYEIKRDLIGKEVISFKVDNVISYLELLYKRLSAPNAPKYTEMSKEKIFWWTVLAIQIALEGIRRPTMYKEKFYNIWVINWKLTDETKSVIKEFQSLHRLADDWKPWKETIGAILSELKQQDFSRTDIGDRDIAFDLRTPKWIKNPNQWTETPEWSNKNHEKKHEVLWPKAEIIREGNMVSYIVQPGDTTQIIRERLWGYPEFNYLLQRSYAPEKNWGWRSTCWINIRNDTLRRMAQKREPLILPAKIEDRKVEAKQFYQYCQEAVQRMENTQYGNRIKALVKNVWVKNIARVMTTFAKCESNLWLSWLYRYEPLAWSYSISYFHILVEDPRGWARAWQNAKKNLCFSDADVMDPVNAWMLFLAYRCEVIPEWKNGNLSQYFNMQGDRLSRCKNKYNAWSKDYRTRLSNAYNAVKNQLT